MNMQALYLLIDSVLENKNLLPVELVDGLLSLQDAALESGINYG